MPWVRLDDRFPSHRKVALLSDRAFRLHVSALCWCAENLTDGVIGDKELRLVAHVRGMTAAARELVTHQLWDRLPDGYQIHDYLDYQFSRDQVLADRQKSAARQQAFRDRKKGKPKPPGGSDTQDKKIERNGVTTPVTNSVSNGCPMPAPDQGVLPNGSTPAGSERPRRQGGIPDRLEPLREALATAGLGAVAWDIRKVTDWERIRRQMDRLGTDLMVKSAVTAARTRGEPDSVIAWIGRWESLADPPAQGITTLPAEAGGEVIPIGASRQQQETNDLFDRAMARAKARMEQEQESS